MLVTLGKDAQAIVDALVAAGRHPSPQAAVEAGLQLLADQASKHTWLRDKIQSASAEGGSYTDEEVEASVEEALDEWEQERRSTRFVTRARRDASRRRRW